MDFSPRVFQGQFYLPSIIKPVIVFLGYNIIVLIVCDSLLSSRFVDLVSTMANVKSF